MEESLLAESTADGSDHSDACSEDSDEQEHAAIYYIGEESNNDE